MTIRVFDAGSGSHTPTGTVSAPIFTGVPLPAHGHDLPPTVDVSIPVVANVGVLTPLPGTVSYVTADAGGAIGPKVMGSPAVPPGPGECTVDFTNGNIRFNAADAVTNCLVTFTRASGPVSAVSGGLPQGTNSAPTFTGNPVSGGPANEVGNGTDLTFLNNVEFEAVGS